MSRKKFECISIQKEIVDALSSKEEVYRGLFDKALRKEKREAHVLRWYVVIALLIVAMAFVVVFGLIWAIPKLLRLEILGFLFDIVLYLVMSVILLAVIRSRLEIINVAFLGAEAFATEKFKELREAEANSRKGGQAKPTQVFKPGTILSEDYIPISLRRKAGEKPKKPKKKKNK